MLPLHWQRVDAVLHWVFALVLRLHLLIVAHVFALLLALLSQMLLQYRLVSVHALCLLFRVVEIALCILLPYVIFFPLLALFFLNVFYLALCLFLKLIAEGHKEVLLPYVELRLQWVCLANL